MSGDMCTSLGNGFTNLMVVLFLVSRKGGTVKGFVEGDDGLFATDVELSVKDFESVGFTVEIHRIEHPCDGHFCGMTCSQDGIVLKDPRKLLMGFGWTSSKIHGGTRVMEELLKSKALSLCYECPQCPIAGVLGREALRLCEGVNAAKDTEWNARPADYTGPTGAFAPSDLARAQFEKIFGVTVADQLVIERAILDHDMDRVAAILPPCEDSAWYEANYVEAR